MGQSTPCAGGATLVYSVESVEGISYHWQVPDGWLIQGVDTTNQITVDAGNLGGVISVTPKNEFGMGEPTILVVTTVPGPDSPEEGVHAPSYYQITWNWDEVDAAEGYYRNETDDLNSAIDNGISTSFTQEGLQHNTPYNYYVWAYNACGDSEATKLFSETLLDETASPTFTWEKPVQPSEEPDEGSQKDSHSFNHDMEPLSGYNTVNNAFSDLSSPVSGNHLTQSHSITWHWHEVQGATGYKYNLKHEYESAVDCVTKTSLSQTGLRCNTPFILYVWAYNDHGFSAVTKLSSVTKPCAE